MTRMYIAVHVWRYLRKEPKSKIPKDLSWGRDKPEAAGRKTHAKSLNDMMKGHAAPNQHNVG